MADQAQRNSRKTFKDVSPADLRKMCPQQKARYLAYAEPSKNVGGSVAIAKQRVRVFIHEKREQEKQLLQSAEEKKCQDALIGQLKAAEARKRVHQKRLLYQKLKEINFLISCQPTALSALRLKLLLPSRDIKMDRTDPLDKKQRRRVEEILGDEKDLTIIRS
ncbi:protein LKAAEAR1-like [Chanos chanos]|uniref:Protein LKAAEAR1-like n=1 Tax=Chanos chanos TaxID=29144 RepID=A0A6J2USY3_CHACN|nr:protein LKAAEAR1 [Chanos chanos]